MACSSTMLCAQPTDSTHICTPCNTLTFACDACAQVPSAVEELLGGKWKREDLLPLNGSAPEVQALRERMLLARAAAKARKEVKRAAAGTPAKRLDAETGPEAAANSSAGAGALLLI